MKVKWKEVAKNLCTQHNKYQAGLTPLDPDGVLRTSGGDIVNVTDDGDLLEVTGDQLTPKQVRAWLWETMRKKRAVARRRAVLWSIVSKGKSYVGVGATAKTQVAEAYVERTS
jgi:hypothetical protein